MSGIDPIYKELAAKLQAEGSKYMPRILEKLANLEQARILRELPSPSDEIAKKLNLDRETVDKDLQELTEKGVVVVTRHGPRMVRSKGQLHDASLGNPKFDESLGKEFFELWAKIEDETVEATVELLTAGGAHPRWRIIPIYKAIKDVPGVLPCEDIREILKAQETLALVHCPCKRAYPNRECGIPDEVCINVGRTAEYNINRGAGRKITVKEAFDLTDEIEKYPIIHATINQRTINMLVCNCHWCCCTVFRPFFKQDKYKVYEGIAKSRFEATVDPEKCIHCKTCVSRCQFGAAQMKYYPEFAEERAYIDPEKCMGCGSCVITCPARARAMKIVRPPEHIPEAPGEAY